jgi:hypothetical protein
MITIASIALISAGVAAFSVRHGAESRPGFDGAPRFDLR